MISAYFIRLTSTEWISPDFNPNFEYYFGTSTGKNWYEARSYCMEEGGDLASILNKNETDWINDEVHYILFMLTPNKIAILIKPCISLSRL